MATPYYSDTDNYGRYQFVTLKSVIDSLLLEAKADDDHYLKNTDRLLLLKYGREGVKELNYETAKEILGIEMTLGENLQMILPEDYVNWVRISVVDDHGNLLPLNVNTEVANHITALQDHEYEYLLDDQYDLLNQDGSPRQREIYFKKYPKNCLGGYSNLDMSKFSKWGSFLIDERNGVINFSSNLAFENVVLEYISDGINWEEIEEEEITIHKFLEMPLMDFIYMRAIERKRNIPDREKQRALNRFNKNKHKAKLRRADFDPYELTRVIRGVSKWVKT